MKGEVYLVTEWRGTRQVRGEVDMSTRAGWVFVERPEARRTSPGGFKSDPPVWQDTGVRALWLPVTNVAGVEF